MTDEQEKQHAKPMLTTEEQLAHLKSKGIAFELCTESEALDYLESANNFLRTASYRKLYFRRESGDSPGTYINLDFRDLVELSAIDRRLREALLSIAIDVEHFSKLRLLRACAEHDEDGYSIVGDYLESISSHQRSRIEGTFKARSADGRARDEYSGDLIAHYAGGYPVWVLFEIIDFGTFVDFWRYCSERWGDAAMKEQHYVLKSVRALRNACAHNSLIANGFSHSAARTDFHPPRLISVSLNEHGLKNTKTRRSKLSNLRVSQIAATLYSANEFCMRESTRKRHAERLASVRDYAAGCEVTSRAHDGITSFYDFIWKLVDTWVPNEY